MDIIEDTKIIFIDIDGTLTNSEKEVTEKTEEVIEKITNKGILVVLCSGRPNAYTINKSKTANASHIVISNSGNLVYDYKNNEVIYINEIKKEHLRHIYNYCETNKIACVFNGIFKGYQNVYSKKDRIIVSSIDEIDEPICQLCITANALEDALIFKEYISKSPIFSTAYISSNVLNKKDNDDEYDFDVMYKNSGKGEGIKKLLEYLNIPVSETMCFGDYINDYSMFKECDITIAMGNSTQKLKELADFTTLTNDNDGVAVFLEDNLL